MQKSYIAWYWLQVVIIDPFLIINGLNFMNILSLHTTTLSINHTRIQVRKSLIYAPPQPNFLLLDPRARSLSLSTVTLHYLNNYVTEL